MTTFKKQHTFNKRISESKKIIDKYPTKIPIIVEKQNNARVPDIDKHKYLVPCDLTMGQFIYVIRRRLKLEPEKSIFIFINNVLPPTSAFIQQIYDDYKDDDGFLYITYSSDNVFGY
tara:strand:- start:4934 stop:5284 length:351 start_codon:yes stop_codon:yes gene_type:complete